MNPYFALGRSKQCSKMIMCVMSGNCHLVQILINAPLVSFGALYMSESLFESAPYRRRSIRRVVGSLQLFGEASFGGAGVCGLCLVYRFGPRPSGSLRD